MQYRILQPDGTFVHTLLRPDDHLRARLEREVDARSHGAHLHAPGDGFHAVPGPTFACTSASPTQSPQRWAGYVPDSTGAILAHAADVCNAFGMSFLRLWQEAHPAETVDERYLAELDRAACVRPATKADRLAVLHDLAMCGLDLFPTVMCAAIAERQTYLLTEDDTIEGPHGTVLYDADSLVDMREAAKHRLAELHSADPTLQWEGNHAEGRMGAWDILIAEELMEPEKGDPPLFAEPY